MKGVVFTLLNEMVEEQFGLEAMDTLLTNAGLEGCYISTETYPDEELFLLVEEASKLTGIDANDLVRSFGEFMLPHFHKNYPTFFEEGMNLKSFLLTVDRVIHVEVKKLFPEAGLPEFNYIDENDNQLTMIYSSPRKLCMLAEGLIAGSAKHFNTQYSLIHDECMHDDKDACHLHITIQ